MIFMVKSPIQEISRRSWHTSCFTEKEICSSKRIAILVVDFVLVKNCTVNQPDD